MGGPEALSWRDIVAIFERMLGRQIPVRFVNPGEPAPGLPDNLVRLLAGMETYDSVVDTSGLARTFGVELTTVEGFARGLFAGPHGQPLSRLA
jgi:NADH dehydrogenase